MTAALRVCITCQSPNDGTNFYRKGTGYQGRCKVCDNRNRITRDAFRAPESSVRMKVIEEEPEPELMAFDVEPELMADDSDDAEDAPVSTFEYGDGHNLRVSAYAAYRRRLQDRGLIAPEAREAPDGEHWSASDAKDVDDWLENDDWAWRIRERLGRDGI